MSGDRTRGTLSGMGTVNVVTLPHDDARVLHAPGECRDCDEHPDWQDLRELWRINYTGQREPSKAPCPSETLCSICRVNRVPVGAHACELCD